MLSSQHRLRATTDFDAVMRRGRASRRAHLVVHVLAPSHDESTTPARAGVAVSRAVGDSVMRHRVARRIRHVLTDALSAVPAGTRIVVRALPASATASSDVLRTDITAALHALIREQDVRVSA